VGWPPVRSFRKNILAVQAALVKVSMDGAPYLRKVDIGACKSYQELSKALEKMFSSFTMAGGSQGIMTRASWWTCSVALTTCLPTRTRTATGCSSGTSHGSKLRSSVN
jgi:hypothetical protein